MGPAGRGSVSCDWDEQVPCSGPQLTQVTPVVWTGSGFCLVYRNINSEPSAWTSESRMAVTTLSLQWSQVVP